MAVESAESGCREGLVNWRISVNPRITTRHRRGKGRELFRKLRINETGVARSAAVMKEPGDRANAQISQARQPKIGPLPVKLFGRLRRDRFPQNRETQGAEAERGEVSEICIRSLPVP